MWRHGQKKSKFDFVFDEWVRESIVGAGLEN